MHTSKNSGSNPYNQFLKPQKDISPSKQHLSKGQKYYSAEQVSRMIKSYIEPKIHFLANQIQQKQRIIEHLNKKLDNNDGKLNKMYQFLQQIVKKQKQMNGTQTQFYQHGASLVNQILNDKMKQYWQTVNIQISRIKQQVVEANGFECQKKQAKLQFQVQNMKKSINEYIQRSRVKNNNYWLKIKQALNRVNSKLSKIDEQLLMNNNNLEDHKNRAKQQYQHISQLQKSKNVIKKLIQLKKSVKNIYDNYEDVLQLQNQFKNRLTDISKNHESSNDLIDFDSEDAKIQTSQSSNLNHGNLNNFIGKQQFNKGGNTFPKFRKKTEFNQQQQLNSNPFQQGSSHFQLEYSRQQQIIQSSLPQRNPSHEKAAFQTKYFVPNISSNKTNKFNLYENSPSRTSPQSTKWQNGLGSPNELSCLNSTSNAYPPCNNSRSTSFVNLSLEHRHHMSESLKQRLQQIIQLKSLTKPLFVYLDQINYLKSQEGNYLFDVRGNMFKLSKEQGKQLQKQGLIKFVNKDSKGNNMKKEGNQMNRNEEYINLNRNVNMNTNGKNSMSENKGNELKQFQNNRSAGKSVPKIKSISIRQTLI